MYFLEVAKVGSISKAAQRLFVTQQNISISIKLNSSVTAKHTADFCKRHPHIKVTISDEALPDIADKLKQTDNSAILLIIKRNEYSEQTLSAQGLEIVAKRNEKLVVCAGPSLPLTKQKTTSVQEILRHPVALLRQTVRNLSFSNGFVKG